LKGKGGGGGGDGVGGRKGVGKSGVIVSDRGR